MVSSVCATNPNYAVSTRELVLSIQGGPRHGQIVRIRSTKCSIGSDRRCTLRLRARGVLPMHCLIVRGDAGAYIRRWAPDTRLNGAAFDDAFLRSGDRLSIGPIEFHVVETGSESARTHEAVASEPFAEPPHANAGSGSRLLPQQPSSPTPESDGRDSPAMNSADARIERAQLEEQKRFLQEEWATLNDRRQQFENQCREALDAQTAVESRLVAKRTELEQWEARLAQAQQSLAEKLNEIEQQARTVAAERDELTRVRAALDAERNRFAVESNEIDRRLTAQAAELTQQRIELSRQKDELESLRQQLLDQRAGWQSQTSIGVAESVMLSTAAAPRSPASPSNPLQSETTADGDDASVVHGDADSEREGFCGDRGSDKHDSTASIGFDDDRPACRFEENERREYGRPTEETEALALRLEDVLRRLGRRENNAAEQGSANKTGETEAGLREHSHVGDAESSLPAQRVRSSEAAGVFDASEPDDDDDAAPGRFKNWSREETNESEDEEATDEPARKSAYAADRGTRTTADSGTEGSGEDDIDAYMADLMRRLGKSHQPAPRQQTTEPSSRRHRSEEDETPQTPAASEKSDAASDAHRRPLSELAPRAIAPEKQLDMDAMRELANQSTRSALDQHAWRSLWQSARSHLATTATMGAVGCGLLWLHFYWIANKLAYYSGLAALGFSVFPIVQYLWTARRLLTHRRSTCDDTSPESEKGEHSANAAGAVETAVAAVAAGTADAVDEQEVAPARIDLNRLDALVAHARTRGVGLDSHDGNDTPQ